MKLSVLILVAVTALLSLTGCEKTDYKHPLHRAQGK